MHGQMHGNNVHADAIRNRSNDTHGHGQVDSVHAGDSNRDKDITYAYSSNVHYNTTINLPIDYANRG